MRFIDREGVKRKIIIPFKSHVKSLLELNRGGNIDEFLRQNTRDRWFATKFSTKYANEVIIRRSNALGLLSKSLYC